MLLRSERSDLVEGGDVERVYTRSTVVWGERAAESDMFERVRETLPVAVMNLPLEGVVMPHSDGVERVVVGPRTGKLLYAGPFSDGLVQLPVGVPQVCETMALERLQGERHPDLPHWRWCVLTIPSRVSVWVRCDGKIAHRCPEDAWAAEDRLRALDQRDAVTSSCACEAPEPEVL